MSKVQFVSLSPFSRTNGENILIPCKTTTTGVATVLASVERLIAISKTEKLFDVVNDVIVPVKNASNIQSANVLYDFIVDNDAPDEFRSFFKINDESKIISIMFSFSGNDFWVRQLSVFSTNVIFDSEMLKFFEIPPAKFDMIIKSLEQYLLSVFKKMLIISPSDNFDELYNKFHVESFCKSVDFINKRKEINDFLFTTLKKKIEISFATDSDNVLITTSNGTLPLKEMPESIKRNVLFAILSSAIASTPLNDCPLIVLQWAEKNVETEVLKGCLDAFIKNKMNYIIQTEMPDVLAFHVKHKGRIFKLV